MFVVIMMPEVTAAYRPLQAASGRRQSYMLTNRILKQRYLSKHSHEALQR